MFLIVGSLIAGIIIGYFDLLPKFLKTYLNSVTTIGLIILLFSMGIKVGINPEVLKNLKSISIQAALLAFGAIIGSVTVVKLSSDVYFKKKESEKV